MKTNKEKLRLPKGAWYFREHILLDLKVNLYYKLRSLKETIFITRDVYHERWLVIMMVITNDGQQETLPKWIHKRDGCCDKVLKINTKKLYDNNLKSTYLTTN